ncbi:unnamed protein product, partial [Laminaria digitata]
GQALATAGDDGYVGMTKPDGCRVALKLTIEQVKPLHALRFCSKSRLLAAAGDAGVVEIWNLRANNAKTTKRGHRRPVTCLTFFDRDTCLAAGD